MKPLKINKLAVGLCVLLSIFCSVIWYYIFEESWMEANELSHGFIREHGNSAPFAIAFIAHFITYYVMAWFFIKLDVRSAPKGVTMAMLMAIAFYFVVQYTNNSFSFRTKTLSFIDGGLILINWMVAGGVLGTWKKYKLEDT